MEALRALAQAPVVDIAQRVDTEAAPVASAIPPVPDALRHKLQTLLAQGSLQPSAAEAPPSPCISVCRMDADRQYCVGCLRTLEEIAAWAGAADEARLAVLAAVEARRQAQESPAAAAGSGHQ